MCLLMVTERVKTLYVCEHCQKEYLSMKDAEKCETRCRRYADSPGLDILDLSARAFNATL